MEESVMGQGLTDVSLLLELTLPMPPTGHAKADGCALRLFTIRLSFEVSIT
jgi:hypothetical protein